MAIVFKSAERLIFAIKKGVKNEPLFFGLFLCIMFFSLLSNASAIAGMESVIKLIYKSWIGKNISMPHNVPINTTNISSKKIN